MYTIYVLKNGTMTIATFEVFDDISEAENKVKEFKKEADSDVRFFIEIQ